ncbi:MAG TPA: hypothetical protein VNT77_10090 [Allosphingosinicella sp.]|nr:hypothetical protein [Allosphingosinicella sp.]
MVNGAWRRALVALGAVLVVTTAAHPQALGQLAALAGLQPGRWELRELDNPRAVPRSICIGDTGMLLQLQHRDLPCSRLVLANEARSATVHYTCPSGGFGRTSLRVDTSRTVVVDTQGIDDNRPFQYRAELRRIGSCASR